jgi:hypothetical protein
MGKLALLCRAIHRFEALEEPLQHDIRRLIGWTLKAEEVAALGEAMRDDWAIVGQWVEDQDALRAQRTWLVGLSKGQHALILQFAHRTQPSFPWVGTPGTRQEMTLHFWPGSLKQRARIAERYGAPLPFAGPLPGETSIAGFLEAEARRLALLPWHDVSLCLLSDVVPVRRKGGHWIIQDAAYHALPMVDSVRWQPPQWRLLAFSGGHPVQFVGEWGGSLVWPLGAFAESRFQEIGPRLSDQRLIDGSGRMDFYAGA